MGKFLFGFLTTIALTFIFKSADAQAPAPGTVTFKYETGLQTNSPSAYADFVPGSGLGQDGGYGYEFITQGTGTTSSFYTQVSYYVFNSATNDGMISFDRNSTNVTIQAAYIRSARTGAVTTQSLTSKPVAGGPFKMQSFDLLAISGTAIVSVQAYNDGVAVGSPQTGTINSTTKTKFDFSANSNFYSIDEIGITGFNSDGVRADNLISTTAVVNTGGPAFSYASPQVYTSGTAISPLGPTITGGAVGAYSAFATFASVNTPSGVALDASGNVYVTDTNDILVYVFNASGVNMAGSPHPGTAGDTPYGIILDGLGNAYIANGAAKTVSVVSLSSGTFSDIKGFNFPAGLAVDASNNVYVTDEGNGNIYKILAGTKTASPILSGFTTPSGIAVNSAGDIFVAQYSLNNIIKVASGTTTKTTFVNTGLNAPYGMAFGPLGNLYVADEGSNTIKKITTGGVLTTISGSGLSYPYDLAFDGSGNMYITNNGANIVRKSIASGYSISATLPAGLSFNNYSGAISGTPTATSATTIYTITATNAQGSSTATVSITVNPAAPVISYASPQVYTVGIAITPLSPTITGGAVTGYTISPALPAGLGIAGGTGIISGTPTAAAAAANYTVTATNTTNSSTAVVNIACGVSVAWTGGSSTTAWVTGGNWSTGTMPGVNDNISIGVSAYTHPFEPVISTADRTVNSITFGGTGHTLTITTPRTLTITSYLTVNTGATPTLTGTGAVNIAPGAIVNIAGSGVLNTTLTGKFTLKSNATGSASIGQILSTSITGSGADSISVERYITGGAGYRGYRVMSSPVYAATVSSNNVYSINYLHDNIFLTGASGTANGFDKSGNPTIYLYREDQAPSNASFTSGNFWGMSKINVTSAAHSNYNYYMNGGSTPYNIPVGNGCMFFFRGDRTTVNPYLTTTTPVSTTVTATGTLNAGQVIVHDWYTSTSANLGWTNTTANAAIRGLNLVGNPYASSIDWETYNTTSTTTGIYASNVGNTIYELNPATNNYNIYQLGGAYTNHGTRTIVSGQGFFVEAANSTSPQLIFNESAKTSAQNTGLNLFMATSADVASLNNATINQHLRLQLAKDTVDTDDIYIGFDAAASDKYVFNEDAPHKGGNGDVSLSSISSDNVTLAINKLPLPKLTQTIIRLKVNATATGVYNLNMKEIVAIPSLFDIWLMDAYKNDSLDMRNNTTYAFNLDKTDTNSYGVARFKLIIRQNPALGLHLLSFTTAKATTGAQVVWKTENEQNYTNFTIERSTDGGVTFDVLGGFLSSALGNYSFLDKNPRAGSDQYRLKLEDLNGKITYSSAVTLMYGDGGDIIANGISVYPNPASAMINLTINQNGNAPSANLSSLQINSINPTSAATQPGNSKSFGIKIINITGSVIISATSSSANWQNGIGNLAPGTYIIQVVDNSNNTLVGKSTFVKM